MSGADQWLMNFHELTRIRAEHLARAEMDKGELEAAMIVAWIQDPHHVSRGHPGRGRNPGRDYQTPGRTTRTS